MKNSNEHNEFVGNFNSFFDNESSLTGQLDTGGLGPISNPISNPTPSPRNPRVAVGPKTVLSPAVAFVLENTPKYRCKITPPYYIRDDINGTILDYTKCPRTTVGVAGSQTSPPSSGSGSGSGTTTTSGGGGSMSGGSMGDGGSMSMGSGSMGGGGSMGSGTEEEAPAESTEQAAPETTGGVKKETECKLDYTAIIIALVIGLAIAYLIAKQKGKDELDIKMFSIGGAILGALIGYVYSKHQCKPIDALTKMGVKSKNSGSVSSYYGGR